MVNGQVRPGRFGAPTRQFIARQQVPVQQVVTPESQAEQLQQREQALEKSKGTSIIAEQKQSLITERTKLLARQKVLVEGKKTGSIRAEINRNTRNLLAIKQTLAQFPQATSAVARGVSASRIKTFLTDTRTNITRQVFGQVTRTTRALPQQKQLTDAQIISRAEEQAGQSLPLETRRIIIEQARAGVSEVRIPTIAEVKAQQSLVPEKITIVREEVPKPEVSGILPSISILGPSFTEKGFFTAEAERKAREAKDISLGRAIVLSGKEAIRFERIGEEGPGSFISGIFEPFERVGVVKEVEEFPVTTRLDFPRSETIISPGFGFEPVRIDVGRLPFGRQRELEDIRKGVPPELAGLPLEVIAQRQAQNISGKIQRQIDTGQITLEEGEELFQAQFKEKFDPIFKAKKGQVKPTLDSGLGKKLEFGTEFAGILALSTTPVGLGIVSAGFVASSVPDFGKAILAKDIELTERATLAGIGTVKAGIGLVGLAAPLGRGPRSLLAQEEAERLAFAAEKVKLIVDPKTSARFVTGPGKGFDILKETGSRGGITFENEFIIPFKKTGEVLRSEAGFGTSTISFKQPFTGKKVIITREIKDIKAKIDPLKLIPEVPKPKGVKAFEVTGEFIPGKTITTVFGEKPGRFILPTGFKPKEIARVDIEIGGKQIEKFTGIGAGKEIKKLVNIPKGVDDFITKESKFLEFVSGRKRGVVAGVKEVGVVDVFPLKTGVARRFKVREEIPRFIQADIEEAGIIKIIDLTKLKRDEDIISTVTGKLKIVKKTKQIPPTTSIFEVAKTSTSLVAKKVVPISKVTPPSQTTSFTALGVGLPRAVGGLGREVPGLSEFGKADVLFTEVSAGPLSLGFGIDKTKPDFLDLSRGAELTKDLTKPLTRSFFKSLTKQSALERQKELTKQRELTKQTTRQQSRQREALRLRELQRQALEEQAVSLIAIKPRIKPTVKPPKLKPKFPILPLIPFKKRPKIKRKKVIARESYNAFAKPEGKKKFVKLNQVPLSKSRAKDVMGFFVDNTLSAKGKISVTKGKIKDARIDVPKNFFVNRQKKFREFKIRKGKKIATPNTFIEKKGKPRIDTFGEKNRLTVLSLLKTKRKQAKKKTQTKTKRRKK